MQRDLRDLGPEEIRKVKERFVNLLCFFQTSLVSPKLRSVSLENVFDALCGNRIDDPFWRENFYMIDGIIKNGLCHRIVNSNFNNEEAKRKILNANKADLLALKEILTRIRNLKVKPPPTHTPNLNILNRQEKRNYAQRIQALRICISNLPAECLKASGRLSTRVDKSFISRTKLPPEGPQRAPKKSTGPNA